MKTINHIDDLQDVRIGENTIPPFCENHPARFAAIAREETTKNMIVDFIREIPEGFLRLSYLWNWDAGKGNFSNKSESPRYQGEDPLYHFYKQVNEIGKQMEAQK